MAFVPVPSGIQANIRYLLDLQEVQNTLYFTAAGGPTPAQLQGAATTLAQSWAASVMPLLGNGLILREVNTVSLVSSTAPTFTLPVVPNIPGGVNSGLLPNNVTLCVSFRTAGRGRSSRGRIYVPGLTEGQVTNNTVTLAYADQLASAVDDVLDAMSAAGFVPVVVSKQFNGVARPTGFPQPITSVVVIDPVIDSQRRRLPKRGR